MSPINRAAASSLSLVACGLLPCLSCFHRNFFCHLQPSNNISVTGRSFLHRLVLSIMMNYQKYYPAPSTYPPHPISIPTSDPRFAPPTHTSQNHSQNHSQTHSHTHSQSYTPASASAPVAVAVTAPPQELGASSSYSHRPLRPYDRPEQPQHEMPRSAPSDSGAYSFPPPDGNGTPGPAPAPALTPHSADTGLVSFRRGDGMYHVSQAGHDSRKGLGGSGRRVRGGQGRVVYQGELSVQLLSSSLDSSTLEIHCCLRLQFSA